MTAIDGGCLCGAVRYHITAEPITTRVCWCRLCQYLGAGSATVNVTFAAQAVAVTGEMHDFESTADSGSHMHRRFCPKCGTHLFSEAEARPHLTVLRAGTLDDPSIARPEITIWTSQAPPWARIDPDIPQHSHQPPRPKA
jgi:hypothetical protein